MNGNKNHRLTCLCPWCRGARKEDLDSFAKRIRKLPKDDLDEKLGNCNHLILKIVRAMAAQYKLMMVWQEKREIVEDRLKELGFKP